jgi:type II secretory pathway pseudopilin PulG
MMRVRKEPFTGRRGVLGVTLVELIAFIVIVAIVAAAMVQAFSGTMRGSHYGKELTQATQLAQERMEVILGQRKRLGYASFIAGDYDPCQPPPAVVAPWSTNQACVATTYTVASTLSAADACGTGCSEITVTVTGPYGDVLARLTEQVWNY